MLPDEEETDFGPSCVKGTSMTEITNPASQQSPQLERDEDFVSVCANNVCYELSAWDLKLIFGVKLMIYYLRAHLAAYEAQYGRVALSPAVLAPAPALLPPEIANEPVPDRRARGYPSALHRAVIKAADLVELTVVSRCPA